MSNESVKDSSDQHLLFLTSNPLPLVFLYRYGLGLIFVFGFIGNLASIITFLQPTLRITSTLV